jgi:hypothetical protein
MKVNFENFSHMFFLKYFSEQIGEVTVTVFYGTRHPHAISLSVGSLALELVRGPV